MCEHFADDALANFFGQQFLASTHYDIYPLVAAATPCGALCGISAQAFVEKRSRDQAPRHLAGVYSFVLAMVPTASVARRLPQLLHQVLDFGTSEVTFDEPGLVRATLSGIPEAIALWLGTVMSGYGEAALRASGASRASFAVSAPQYVGMARGVRMARCEIEISWGK